jgi:chemotaxis protein methyltransferase CheR
LERITLKKEEFNLIRELVYKMLGIKLSTSKNILVLNRLQKILTELNFDNFTDYYQYVINEPSGNALSRLIERITTNHTYFYRECEHFNFLEKNVLPEIINRSPNGKRREIRIWIAGCATGEEAYTVSMVLKEFILNEKKEFDFHILATDISRRAILIAKNGEYPLEKISELPFYFQKYYLLKDNNGMCSIKNEIKSPVVFRLLNLNRESFPFQGKFDIIFCRNVMIYFGEESKNRLIEQFHKYTKYGGYLFIGHAESLSRRTCPFSYIKPSVYKKI